jgi:hypothetical protein
LQLVVSKNYVKQPKIQIFRTPGVTLQGRVLRQWFRIWNTYACASALDSDERPSLSGAVLEQKIRADSEQALEKGVTLATH